MTTAPGLYDLEISHGKSRLTHPRPTALGTDETGAVPSEGRAARGRFGRGNKEAAESGAKRALRRSYAEARERIKEALARGGEDASLPEADVLLGDALRVHLAGMRELRVPSVYVQGPSLVYAIESVLHGYFMEAAARAGFLTERGAELKAMADTCATAQGRAMTACLAAAKFLGGRRKRKSSALASIEAAGEAVEDEGGE